MARHPPIPQKFDRIITSQPWKNPSRTDVRREALTTQPPHNILSSVPSHFALSEHCNYLYSAWASPPYAEEELSSDDLVLAVINRCGPDAVARVLASVARVSLAGWVGRTKKKEASVEANESTYMALLSVAKEAIISLLDERDFFGAQLSHVNGEISDDAFEEILDARAAKATHVDREILAQKTARLGMLIKDRIDADVVSTVFSCSLDQARSALGEATAALEMERGDINAVLATLWPDSDTK
jgi:hypothetical protein